MPQKCVINVDLAKIFSTDGKKFLTYLSFGDFVEVDDQTSAKISVRVTVMEEQADGSVKPVAKKGVIKANKNLERPIVIPAADSKVLKVNFVDVQQGDGSVIETPGGKVMLVDGGDNQLFARYLANRYRGTSLEEPKAIDCVLVTHGDADHFLGLTKIIQSETIKPPYAHKRLFIKPLRIFHNGIIKGPSSKNGKSVPDAKLLGATKKLDGELYLTELADTLTEMPDAKLNVPFKTWKNVLAEYQERYDYEIEQKRLVLGDDSAFDFLKAGEPLADQMKIEVLGPIPRKIDGEDAFLFLGNPTEEQHIERAPDQPDPTRFSGYSASHTINGHSVVFRLTYGGFKFLFTGDLNAQSELDLLKHHKSKLSADVFKAPHHGSADFSAAFIEAVRPIISAVSSGDESERKEYIHPRASLVGALGRHSRVDKPLIFITELAAFFAVRGYIDKAYHKNAVNKIPNGVVNLNDKKNSRFFAFSRSAFGLIKIRTDGKRLLVYTDSGNVKLKEAYAFECDAQGNPKSVDVVKT